MLITRDNAAEMLLSKCCHALLPSHCRTRPRSDKLLTMNHARLVPESQSKVQGLAWCAVLMACAFWFSGCKQEPSTAKTPSTSTNASVTKTEWFRDETTSSRLAFQHQLADGKMDNIMESNGAGGAVLDYDNDGWLDLYLVNSGPAPVLSDAPAGTSRKPNRLFRNLHNGTFQDVTYKAGVAGTGFGTTSAAADYDNDGDADLLVVNFGGLTLYQNQGNGTFKDVTAAAGLNSTHNGISATFFDADMDGYLDLFVANYLVFDPTIKPPPGANAPYSGPTSYEHEFCILYRNSGHGTFTDVSKAAGILIPNHRAMSVTPFDCDSDGDHDLYVSNDGTPNLLLINDGKGHFKEEALQRGVAFNQFGEAAGSMGATVADVNHDNLPDVFVTRFGSASLYINTGKGFFEDRIQASGILRSTAPYTGWGGAFADFDNDGNEDLFIVNGHAHFLQPMPSLLMVNRGDGSYEDASDRAGAFFRNKLNARGCMAADFDNDGRTDLVISDLGGPALFLRNVLTNSNHWLDVRLEGANEAKDAFGARVRVTAGTLVRSMEARCCTSYVSQHDSSRLHFGLGTNTLARVEVRWPSGETQSLPESAVDRVIHIKHPGTGAIPVPQ